MRARVSIIVEWELGAPDDYPEEVGDWNSAINSDLRRMSIPNLNSLDVVDDREIEVSAFRSWSRIEDEGREFKVFNVPFERSGDGPDASFPERPYIPPPSPFYGEIRGWKGDKVVLDEAALDEQEEDCWGDFQGDYTPTPSDHDLEEEDTGFEEVERDLLIEAMRGFAE